MTGAVIGTTMMEVKMGATIGTSMLDQARGVGPIVALTINNICQLSCPMCYLETGHKTGLQLISPAVLTRMWSMCPARVAIVGKEALFNAKSRRVTADIVREGHDRGIPVDLITNGMNLASFVKEYPDEVRLLHHIDVSIDAPHSQEQYEQCRPGGVLENVICGIRLAQKGGAEIRILNTLHATTLPWVEETVARSRELTDSWIMFSPFIATNRASGSHTMRMMEISTIVDVLSASPSFMANSRALVGFDPYYCEFSLESLGSIQEAGRIFGDHLLIIKETPAELGIVRITYDGFVLDPFVALNTAQYPVAEKTRQIA